MTGDGSSRLPDGADDLKRADTLDLDLDVAERAAWTVVAVRGEVDFYSVPQLREQLVRLIDQGKAKIVVDLEEVGFLDSSGLGVLINCLRQARARDGDLLLVCRQRRIRKLLEITGLMGVFGIHESVEAATGPR